MEDVLCSDRNYGCVFVNFRKTGTGWRLISTANFNLQISAVRETLWLLAKKTQTKSTKIKIDTVIDSQRLYFLPVYNLSIILGWT